MADHNNFGPIDLMMKVDFSLECLNFMEAIQTLNFKLAFIKKAIYNNDVFL